MKIVYAEWKSSDFYRAQQELKNLLRHQEIPTEICLDEVATDREWVELQKRIESTGKLCVVQDVSSFCISYV